MVPELEIKRNIMQNNNKKKRKDIFSDASGDNQILHVTIKLIFLFRDPKNKEYKVKTIP